MHRDFIDCLVFVKKPCPMLITGGRDGRISLWDPNELTIIKGVEHRDNNSVYREELYKSMDTLLKAQCAKFGSSAASDRRKKERVSFLCALLESKILLRVDGVQIAITAMCPLLNSGLLCVGSADCCVTIYELGNQVRESIVVSR